MNLLNIKMHKDGNRTILVFDGCKPDTEEMIKKIISGLTGGAEIETENINNVVPINTKPEPMPEIPQTTIPNINENQLIQEKGFKGYVEVYQFFLKYKNSINADRKKELLSFINQYATWMRNRNVAEIPDNELYEIIDVGLETLFKKKTNEILRETTCATVVELLNGGRPYWEFSYQKFVS